MAYSPAAKNRATPTAYQILYRARRAAGRCVQCADEMAAPGQALGERCRARMAAAYEARRANRRRSPGNRGHEVWRLECGCVVLAPAVAGHRCAPAGIYEIAGSRPGEVTW